MRNFVDNVIVELNSDKKLNGNSLVKLVVESTTNSITNGENPDKIYDKLKTSILEINEHLNSSTLDKIVKEFEENEDTVDARVYKLSKVGNLYEKLNTIKESNAYSNPLISQKVDSYIERIDSGILEFTLYPQFVSEFESHIVEREIEVAINSIHSTIEENRKEFEVLFSINQMKGGPKFPLYEDVCNYLKECIATGKYSSDSINMKFKDLNLPIVNALVENLKSIESQKSNIFNLGNGSSDTRIDNVIAPATKSVDEGIIIYHDDRFISISEKSELTGHESKVHINEGGFTISTMKPEYVKENYSNFYSVCEAYGRLGFKKSENNSGIESSSIRNFKMGFAINEENGLDLLINDEIVDDVKTVNVSEALVMESNTINSLTKTLFENLDSLSNFEFIKNASNHKTLKECTVFKLKDSFFLCENTNISERNWKKVNALELYEYFLGSYEYDIKNTFGTELTKQYRKKLKTEKKKFKVQENISKLEKSVAKLDEALSNKGLDTSKISKLEKIKESLIDQINIFKEKYISLSVNEGSGCSMGNQPTTAPTGSSMKEEKDNWCNYVFKCGYEDCTKEQKDKCDKWYSDMDEEKNTWCINRFKSEYADCNKEQKEQCDKWYRTLERIGN